MANLNEIVVGKQMYARYAYGGIEKGIVTRITPLRTVHVKMLEGNCKGRELCFGPEELSYSI